ncbi:Dynein light chain cytoplasmic [Fasciolopsis buskii]|uniref:Dynein light chain n=1 Tax=Fasciolopsis buskii TaxID=27845 RepID=A0A8E0RUB7_9TREM|nr:Dynein light chain cytoplasmic [Fasciolopsis buski]
MGERKAVVKNADMSNDMQEDAVHTAASAMDKYQVEKDVAAFVKKEFDRKYSPTWHCVVGKSFGSRFTTDARDQALFLLYNNFPILILRFSYVTHESGNFIYFYLQDRAFLLFKSG